jgi:hypothetical protein
MKQRAAGFNPAIQYSVRGGGNIIKFMNQNAIQLNPKQATRTLNKIYKLCKTDEDYEEEDEDSESLERANELFNSMMKKQVN